MKKFLTIAIIVIIAIGCGAPQGKKAGKKATASKGEFNPYSKLTEAEITKFIKAFPVFTEEAKKYGKKMEKVKGKGPGAFLGAYNMYLNEYKGMDGVLKSKTGIGIEDFIQTYIKVTTSFSGLFIKEGMVQYDGMITKLEQQLKTPNLPEQQKKMVTEQLKMYKEMKASADTMLQEIPPENIELVKKYKTKLSEAFKNMEWSISRGVLRDTPFYHRKEEIIGNITYCIIDVTDPRDEFECEGRVIETFFSTSDDFDFKKSHALIRPKADLKKKLKSFHQDSFNIFHFAAHGIYFKKTKQKLDYTAIYQKRGKREVEVFRPDTIVRLGLKSDVFISTSCETFNDYFLEIIRGYGGIKNFIAPIDSPISGETIIFSLMFYNELIREIASNQKEIKDKEILKSFRLTKKGYKSYRGKGNFKLYNYDLNRIYE